VEVWIGLAHVKPRPTNHLLEGAIGAFVLIVALSNDQDEFVAQIYSAMGNEEFDVIEIEDIEPWRLRKERCIVDPEIHELVTSLSQENPIARSYFHAYESE
jgi:hypothetical protein